MGRKDLDELREVLDTLSRFLPKLLNEIFGALTDAEDAAQLADDIALFYKKLVDAGMEKEQAFELTKKFMTGRDKGAIIMQAISQFSGSGKRFKILHKHIKKEEEMHKRSAEEQDD